MDTYEKHPIFGLYGQLYEIRLVSLVLLRLLHDADVEEFYLASNMADIGAFDDISFRAKIKGFKKPILVFVQAKHKEDGNSFLEYDLIKNFHESYIKVKDNFYALKTPKQDVFFNGKFEEYDCVFILYTNAKFYQESNITDFDRPSTSTAAPLKQIRKQYESDFAAKLSSLIGTSDEYSQGSQADYTEEDLEIAADKISEEEIITLADRLSKFLNDQSMNMMLDKYVLLYHVILAQRVVNISEVKSEEVMSVKKEKVEKAGGQPDQESKANQSKNKKDIKPHANKTTESPQDKTTDKNKHPHKDAISDVNPESIKAEQISKNKCKQSKPGQAPGNKFQKNEQDNKKELVISKSDTKRNNTKDKSKQIADSNQEAVKSEKDSKLTPGEINSEQDIKIKTQESKHPQNSKPIHGNICTESNPPQNKVKCEVKKPKQEQKEKENKQEQKPEIRKYRKLTFRPDFFDTDDNILKTLRDKLYEIIINTQIRNTTSNQNKNKKKQKAAPKDETSTSSVTDSEKKKLEKSISEFLSEPSATSLSLLIGQYIVYKDNKLQFIVERPTEDLDALEQINRSQSDIPLVVQEAELMAAKRILSSKDLKVPATFGNIDLTIAGDGDKIENRLNTLMEFLVKLCQKSKANGLYNDVIIDKSVGAGFLNLTGGIGGAVGNLLIYDKATKLLMFVDSSEENKEEVFRNKANAGALFDKLKGNTNIATNFHTYRFDTRALIDFPKLEFDFRDEARNVLSKVVVYEKQGNHNTVAVKLNEEIHKYQTENITETQNITVQTDKISVYYQNEIRKWWMTSKSAKYLTKSSKEFQNSMTNILLEPQISALQVAYFMNHINNTRYDLNEQAIDTVKSIEDHARSIIVTDISTLTTLKIVQYLRNKENNRYAILDFEFVLNLPTKDFTTLTSELKDTEKMIIFVCNNPKSYRLVHKTLDVLAETTTEKNMIVITNTAFVQLAQQYFGPTDNVINDERQSLKVLTPESMRNVIENSPVIFQGNEINLDSIVNDESAEYVKGAILNKIVCNKTIVLGKSVSDRFYEKIQYLYVERKVHKSSHDEQNNLYDYVADYGVQKQSRPKGYYVRRFEDINEDAVLITGAPGMGKSTLLTRLSLKAKEHDKQLWIVRVNLLDHSKAFFDWQTHKTVIDIPETLKVICQVIIKDVNFEVRVKETNDKVYLEDTTGDEWADFELNMFLHFYNERKLLLLFDGFDEICPHYKDNVIDFLNVVMNYPRKHKLWVTSRPYSEILPDLQRVLGKSYDLEYINDSVQEIYLDKYWKRNLKIQDLNAVQLRKVISYLDFMRDKDSPTICRIFHLFNAYVRQHFPDVRKLPTYDQLIPTSFNPNLTDLKGTIVERRVDVVMGTPLLLYLYASYFVSLVTDDADNVDWKLLLEFSMHLVFERYVKSKIKILFKIKNEMDVYAPDVMRKYDKDYMDCIDIHKRLAAYTLFFHRIHLDEIKHLHPFKEESDYDDVIDEIKCGAEKVGLVSHVTADNIAVFIYKSLEEYFATEFLCDVFKNDDIDMESKNMLYSIAHITYGMDLWLGRKMAADRELCRKMDKLFRLRPFTVDIYGHLFASGWPVEQLIRIRSSTAEDYEPGCFDEYNEKDYKIIRRLESEEKDLRIKEFQKNVIAKMKPRLKQYFTTFPGEGDL